MPGPSDGTQLYFGPTLKAASGVDYSNVGGFRIPVNVAVALTGIVATEIDSFFSSDKKTMTAHVDWELDYSYLVDPIGDGVSHRMETAYGATVTLSDFVNFGIRLGLFGEWGKTDPRNSGSSEVGDDYSGIGEDFGIGSSGGPNGPMSDYWALGLLAGPRFDIMPFKPKLPLAIFVEGDFHIGGGARDGSGTPYVGGAGLAGLQLAFF